MQQRIEAACHNFYNTAVTRDQHGNLAMQTDLMVVAREEEYPPQLIWFCQATLALILSQHQSGIDITTPQYSRALNTCHQAMLQTGERILQAAAKDRLSASNNSGASLN